MAYTEVTVIVDGVEEEHYNAYDYAVLEEHIKVIEEEAKAHGYPTQLFILYHEHGEDQGECTCIEYVQDHKPFAQWNVKEE